MPRPIGSKNKNSSALPEYSMLSSQQRIELLANLIVDRILEDQASKQKLFNRIMEKDYA
jgi:hypothetical protein